MNVAQQTRDRRVTGYYLYTLLISLSFYAPILVPFFTAWGGLTLAQVQLLQSWGMLLLLFLDVPTGALADRIGKKYVLAAGGFVAALGCAFYALTRGFAPYLAGEALISVGLALTSGADDAFLYETVHRAGESARTRQIFGRVNVLGLLAGLVAALAGGIIATQFGLSAPLLWSAVPLLGAGIVALGLGEDRRAGRKDSTSGVRQMTEGIGYLLRHRDLRTLTLDRTLVAVAAYYVLWLYQPALQGMHVPLELFGIVSVIAILAQMIVSHSVMRLERAVGSGDNLLRVSALLTAVGFLAAGLAPSPATVILFVILADGFGATRSRLIAPSLNALIPADQRATVLSAVSSVGRLAVVALNPFVGLLADHALGLTTALVGLLPLAACALAWPRRHGTAVSLPRSDGEIRAGEDE